METEDLKMQWQQMNERLKNMELINERLLKDVLVKRVFSAKRRIFNYEFFGIFFLLIAIFFLGLQYNKFVYYNVGSKAISAIVFMTIIFIYQVFKVIVLGRWNIAGQNVIKVIQRANFYKKWVFWELILASIATVLFTAILIYDAPVSFLFLSCVYLGMCIYVVGMSIWLYIAVYKRNLSEIQKSLEELKEFEKEN